MLQQQMQKNGLLQPPDDQLQMGPCPGITQQHPQQPKPALLYRSLIARKARKAQRTIQGLLQQFSTLGFQGSPSNLNIAPSAIRTKPFTDTLSWVVQHDETAAPMGRIIISRNTGEAAHLSGEQPERTITRLINLHLGPKIQRGKAQMTNAGLPQVHVELPSRAHHV
jgi:hypothetical protein